VADAALAAAREVLGRLPCPTLAIGGGQLSPAGAALADAFDVFVADAADLDPILATIARNPQAATALVQLLRHNDGLDIHQGLIAESFVYSTLQSGREFAKALSEYPKSARPAPMQELESAVRVERDGDRLSLTLNRPRKHNAFSAEMRDAFVEALRVAVGDETIRVVELSGAGRSFSSGGDLGEFGTFPDPATAHLIRSTRSPARVLASCAERVHCRVHGACVGAGTELPAFAKHVSAAVDAYFMLPEVGLGLVPGAGGTVSLPRRIGRQRTAELALSGRSIDAETAHRWGLVDELRY
jgi:enoyl-CoA hydratase/carnithine racemase